MFINRKNVFTSRQLKSTSKSKTYSEDMESSPFDIISNALREEKPIESFTEYLSYLIQWEKCVYRIANTLFGYDSSPTKIQFLLNCGYDLVEVKDEDMIGFDI